jgi:hypothetical protein
MQMNLLATGLLLPGKVDALLKLKREQLRQSVKEGFRESGPKMREIMHRQVSGAMKIRRQSFLKSYRVRHFDQKTDRLPAMLVGSTQKLAAVHESGGVIRPRGKLLLIPIGGLRVGQKTFKRNVEQLLRSGNAFFKKMPNGRKRQRTTPIQAQRETAHRQKKHQARRGNPHRRRRQIRHVTQTHPCQGNHFE